MTAMLSALLENQARTRAKILDAEGIEARHRKGAKRTAVTGYNAFGWATNHEARKHPKPFNTEGWEGR